MRREDRYLAIFASPASLRWAKSWLPDSLALAVVVAGLCSAVHGYILGLLLTMRQGFLFRSSFRCIYLGDMHHRDDGDR